MSTKETVSSGESFKLPQHDTETVVSGESISRECSLGYIEMDKSMSGVHSRAVNNAHYITLSHNHSVRRMYLQPQDLGTLGVVFKTVHLHSTYIPFTLAYNVIKWPFSFNFNSYFIFMDYLIVGKIWFDVKSMF